MAPPPSSSSHKPEHEQRPDGEKSVGRNPHPHFKAVEASRPDWEESQQFHFTKTRDPDWKLGDGPNDKGKCLEHEHVEIDPDDPQRPAVFNYKLLISAIVPRPIGFVSTVAEDERGWTGQSTNLAPFSYHNVINHDPPLFILSFAGGLDNAKDSILNLIATKECTINVISEHYIEAANATSINAPHGTSEWALAGLHPAPSRLVKPPRVREAVFSVEGRLYNTQEFESRREPGKKTGVLAIVEGLRFWVREDAVNEERNLVDPTVLKPMSRLGGISYGRLTEAIEIPRPEWSKEVGWAEEHGLVKNK